jgi:hypothetical protein
VASDEGFAVMGNNFHQYQQNQQSSLTFTHWRQKRGDKTYDIANLGPGLGHPQTCDIRGNQVLYLVPALGHPQTCDIRGNQVI